MIFLGVGTNMGKKKKNILDSYELLEKKGLDILRKSSMYHSAAWGIRDQDSFINALIEVSFSGHAEQLLNICLEVEKEMGRQRAYKWGPRLIDIDIIDFHGQVIKSDHLILPHPYYSQRAFVLAPLAELEPDWTIDGKSESIQELLETFSPEDACTRIVEDE